MANGALRQKLTFGSRVRYAFDNFMARGGFSVFLAVMTMFLIGFIAMAILRSVCVLIWPDESAPKLADGLWRTFIEIADAGNIGDDSEAPYMSKAIGVGTIFVGMVLFSSMVATITAQFEAKLEALRKGKSAVIESGHSVILGFGDRVVDIIRELVIANESEKDAAIVVLAEKDKEEMDDFFNERVPDRKTTRLVTRSGSTSNVASLHNIGVVSAKSITILSDARSGDSSDAKSRADARVLKTIIAAIAASGENDLPPVVAELHFAENRNLAESIVQGKVTTLAEDSLLAKMMVQTSRVSGLALVYSDLVGFEGNEVYFFRPPGGWPQVSFGQLQYHFPESVPLGVIQPNGVLMLNPPAQYVLRPEDEAIVLAEDDSKTGFSPTPVFTPRQIPLSDQRATTGPERQLVVGWTNKSSLIIGEYSEYLKPGSAVHIVVEQVTDEIQRPLDDLRKRYPHFDLSFLQLDISSPSALAEICPHTYDNVIILGRESGTAEESDAATIATLLRFRQYFKDFERTTGQTHKTQLIAEVMDSDNTDIVLKVGVQDYLISNQFVSKIFAQVAQEPRVERVYDELFRVEGSEIYLKPVELFFGQIPISVCFGDCVSVAQARKEVCLGYKLVGEEGDADKNHGIHLIPRKTEQVTLGPGDCLITLAEDES